MKVGKAEPILCQGVPTFVTPVYIARVRWNGSITLDDQRPIYYSCDRCGEILRAPVTT